MVEVRIPRRVRIGGFDYKVVMSQRFDEELQSDRDWGQCTDIMRRILISTEGKPQQISQTFIHEVLHAIDGIYGTNKLEEAEIHALSNGLLQVFEQLGIRFIKG